MTERKRKMLRWLLLLALLPIILFLLALALHPYLSVTEPSGSDVAVVEGWIPPDLMPMVKEEIERRGYKTIYTTGTIRPFSYWMKEHGSITVELPRPMEGEVKIVAAGLPGAQLLVLADEDTMMVRSITGDIAAYWVQLQRPTQRLKLQPINTAAPDGADVIFVKELAVHGENAHRLHRSIVIENGNGNVRSGSPTYAHFAAHALEELGLPARQIIPVPAEAGVGKRTAGNAQAFAIVARADGVDAVDVISMGVHARRSRKVYQNALGDDVEVGVVSLPDPDAQPGNWWHGPIGWVRLLKELVGLPVAEF